MESLFDRLGGEHGVLAAVQLFYERVMADPSLEPFFRDIDVPKQVRKQAAFLTMAFGGSTRYDGHDLRSAHVRLVKQGLSDVHFDAVGQHLAAALAELDVQAELIAEVLALVETTRDDVLCRAKRSDG